MIVLTADGSPVWAAGRVQLELAADARAPLTGQQQWLRWLARAGVSNLRIRARRPTERLEIQTQGTKDRPVYRVTGMLNSRNELLLPGARFQPGDATGVARWLDDLAKNGPPEQREEKSAFGLSRPQFEEVLKDMALPVGFSTEEINRGEVIERIGQRLLMPIRIDRGQLAAIKEDKLGEELADLSRGTALAYLLRPLGLCLVPQATGSGGVEYAIIRAKAGQKVWPVGWPPEKPRRDVLPALFEFLNVNIQGVSVAQALEAIGKRLKVPILWDQNAMARHGIRPDKVQANLPRSRTTYSLILRKVLFQARLKGELRVDEAGKAFLWITTIKPA